MNLSSYQKEFILEKFFKNEEYAGWRNIALTLLDYGTCIIAGETRLWNGGIGNFVKITQEAGLIDCVRYTFDLKTFLGSKYFKGFRDSVAGDKREYLIELRKQLEDLESL